MTDASKIDAAHPFFRLIPEVVTKGGAVVPGVIAYLEGADPWTVRGALKLYLVANALFPDQANAILDDMAAGDPGIPNALSEVWHRPIAGYPDPMHRTLVLLTNSAATKWIDANAPMHWARAVFAGSAP